MYGDDAGRRRPCRRTRRSTAPALERAAPRRAARRALSRIFWRCAASKPAPALGVLIVRVRRVHDVVERQRHELGRDADVAARARLEERDPVGRDLAHRGDDVGVERLQPVVLELEQRIRAPVRLVEHVEADHGGFGREPLGDVAPRADEVLAQIGARVELVDARDDVRIDGVEEPRLARHERGVARLVARPARRAVEAEALAVDVLVHVEHDVKPGLVRPAHALGDAVEVRVVVRRPAAARSPPTSSRSAAR